eukprot:scaffold146_cov171-Ochromonas_danica.AAC.26
MQKEHRLLLAIGLSTTFMIIEVIGGYWANSIAIFSDAAHLLTDIAGFGIALVAAIAAKAPGTKTLTFGFARAEVFGALGSVLSLWVITAFLLYAAYDRAIRWLQGNPEPVNGFLMFAVACFGVLVNICLGWVFHDEHGGAFHPAHSHDHGHCEHHGSPKDDDHHVASPSHDHEHAHEHGSHEHDHDHNHHNDRDEEEGHWTCVGDECGDHEHEGNGHDHSHSSKGHEHDHGHSSNGIEHDHDHERLPLLPNSQKNSKKYGGCEGHGHDHGHTTPKPKEKVHDDHDGHSHGHSHGHHGSDVNIEAAYLHVLTDLIQSIGVALAGLIMWRWDHVEIIDPICTLVFSIVALYSTVPLLHRVSVILFEGAPSHAENPQVVLREAHNVCRSLGIDHATIQVHDAADEAFCYSQTCDWEHAIEIEEGANHIERKNLCMTTRNLGGQSS